MAAIPIRCASVERGQTWSALFLESRRKQGRVALELKQYRRSCQRVAAREPPPIFQEGLSWHDMVSLRQ
jgi:hypothetical protein